MTTSPVNIDYDAILKGLIAQCNYSETDIDRFQMSPTQALRELRTVGISTPRQKGKTSWMMRKLVEDPDSLAVVRNSTARRIVLQSLDGQIDEGRVITVYDAVVLLKMVQSGKPVEWRWFSTVYLDDSSTMREGHLEDFYKWLALNPEWKKTIVIRLS